MILSNFINLLIESSVKGSLLLILILIFIKIFRNLSATTRYILWQVVLISQIIIPIFILILPEIKLSTDLVPSDSYKAISVQSSDIGKNSATPAVQNLTEINTEDKPSIHKQSDVNSAIAVVRNIPQDAILMGIWICGLLLFAIKFIIGYYQIYNLQPSLIKLKDQPLNIILLQSIKVLNINSPIYLYLSDEISVPITRGMRKHQIILPLESVDWPKDRQEAIILHELMHIKRKDYLLNILLNIVSILYWFNPLIWIARKWHYAEGEKACDDYVILSGADPDNYAQHLLDSARSLIKSKWAPKYELAMAKRSFLEGRLLSILNDRVKRKYHTKSLISVAVFACTSVLLLSLVHISFSEDTKAVIIDNPQTGLLENEINIKINILETFKIPVVDYNRFSKWSPGLLRVGNNGEIYVFDYRDYTIKKFDNTGNYLLNFGRWVTDDHDFKNNKADQFSWLTSMSITPNGNILVFDSNERKLVRFDQNGVCIDSIYLMEKYGKFYANNVIMYSDDHYLIFHMSNDSSHLFSVFDEKFNRLESFGEIHESYDKDEHKPIKFINEQSRMYQQLDRSFLVTKEYYDHQIFIYDQKNPTKIIKNKHKIITPYELYICTSNEAESIRDSMFYEKGFTSCRYYKDTAHFKRPILQTTGLYKLSDGKIIHFVKYTPTKDDLEFGIELFNSQGQFLKYEKLSDSWWYKVCAIDDNDIFYSLGNQKEDPQIVKFKLDF